MDLLVVSTFEGGYQPTTALAACTVAAEAGFSVRLLDVYVDGLQLSVLKQAPIIAISIPLFDSLSSSVALVKQVRSVNARASIIFFGQYATLNSSLLSKKYSDYTLVGEFERPLVALLTHLQYSKPLLSDGICSREMAELGRVPHTLITRGHIRQPQRSFAPPLTKYPQSQVEKLLGHSAVVGGLETSRGCVHKCAYCSVYAAYQTKVVRVEASTVLADAAALVDAGMTHLTFTDADFFNVKRHNLQLIKMLHERYPELTFDFTTRVDFILEYAAYLPSLADYGVRFITSALEFPNQAVLDIFAKDITVDDIEDAIGLCRAAGITLNPTFILFNPWINTVDLEEFEAFVARNELAEIIDPVQYETRLKLYKGSPLLKRNSTAHLELYEEEFHYEWQHPDPMVDQLYRERLTIQEPGTFKRCCLKC